MASKTKLTKKQVASKLGVSVSALYYDHKKPLEDIEVKNQIEAVLTDNPAYGHKRIALALKLNKKRILRVMKKFGLKPFRRRTKKLIKKNDLNRPEAGYENLIKGSCPIIPNLVWISDFTYIKYQGKFIYLATIEDLYTREVLGTNISRFHNKELVLGALEDALKKSAPPQILHSDQGSEYDSQAYTCSAEKLGIKISMSKKGSPWENGFKESFYSQFKLELGDVNRFEELGELIEAIYQQIFYYNNERIHTFLKTSPLNFRELFYKKWGT